jgi:hypothetical protein
MVADVQLFQRRDQGPDDPGMPVTQVEDAAVAVAVEVVSSFLCKIFIGQFFEERQVLTHFSYRA